MRGRISSMVVAAISVLHNMSSFSCCICSNESTQSSLIVVFFRFSEVSFAKSVKCSMAWLVIFESDRSSSTKVECDWSCCTNESSTTQFAWLKSIV